MAITPITKAHTIPTTKTTISVCVITSPQRINLTILTIPQPNMTGIAKKNVNSAAAVREQPHNIPPIMVAPERLVPGTIASTWKKPILIAIFQSISLTSLILNMPAFWSSFQKEVPHVYHEEAREFLGIYVHGGDCAVQE